MNILQLLIAVVCITDLGYWAVCVSTIDHCSGVLDQQRVNELSYNNLTILNIFAKSFPIVYLFKCLFLGRFNLSLFDYYV